jgi:hypothetical protein
MGGLATLLMRDAFWVVVLISGLSLGGYLLWFDEPGEPSRHKHDLIPALFEGGSARLSAIELQLSHGKVRVERGADGWAYVEGCDGFDLVGSTAARFIAARVQILAAARVERSFAADNLDLESFGLAPSAMQVTLYFSADETPALTLSVGARTADGFGQYLLSHPGERIITLPAYQIDNLVRLAQGH